MTVPARRSRTHQWRRSLEQVHERGGSLEIAVRPGAGDDEADRADLIWRVLILALRDDEIVVEQPTAMGEAMDIAVGTELVGIMVIGQNRWSFATKCIGTSEFRQGPRRTVRALRLEMPESVERLSRRGHYRLGTTSLNMPDVTLWPLLDPRSVVLAERANELQFQRLIAGQEPGAEADPQAEGIRPDVGPAFKATLQNIGGGGLGLRVGPEHAAELGRHRVFWLQMTLPPDMPHPICATAKVAHTHLLSDQGTYVGMSFDFTHNAEHQTFVVDQIARFIGGQQRRQQAVSA